MTLMYKQQTLIVSLNFTKIIKLFFKYDWLITMLFQCQQRCWPRNMLHLVKSGSAAVHGSLVCGPCFALERGVRIPVFQHSCLEFPISRSLSTSRRRTDELGYRLERPIHFECKLNEPMHIGMRLLHPAAADHSVSINRQQVQRIFSFSLRSRAVTSFCSWLLLNEWIQRVEHALRKTLVLVVVLPMSSGLHTSGCTSPCLCCRWPSPLFASAC